MNVLFVPILIEDDFFLLSSSPHYLSYLITNFLTNLSNSRSSLPRVFTMVFFDFHTLFLLNISFLFLFFLPTMLLLSSCPLLGLGTSFSLSLSLLCLYMMGKIRKRSRLVVSFYEGHCHSSCVSVRFFVLAYQGVSLLQFRYSVRVVLFLLTDMDLGLGLQFQFTRAHSLLLHFIVLFLELVSCRNRLSRDSYTRQDEHCECTWIVFLPTYCLGRLTYA